MPRRRQYARYIYAFKFTDESSDVSDKADVVGIIGRSSLNRLGHAGKPGGFCLSRIDWRAFRGTIRVCAEVRQGCQTLCFSIPQAGSLDECRKPTARMSTTLDTQNTDTTPVPATVTLEDHVPMALRLPRVLAAFVA